MACLHQSIDQGGRYIDEGGETDFDLTALLDYLHHIRKSLYLYHIHPC